MTRQAKAILSFIGLILLPGLVWLSYAALSSIGPLVRVGLAEDFNTALIVIISQIFFWGILPGAGIIGLVHTAFIAPRVTLHIFKNGHEATANIIEKKVTTETEGGDSYHLIYQYEVGAKHRHQGEHRNVRKEVWDALSIGAPLTILYHPQKPAESRVVDLCDDYEILT